MVANKNIIHGILSEKVCLSYFDSGRDVAHNPVRSVMCLHKIVLTAVLLASVTTSRADTIYSLVNFAAGQDGWNLTGAITTDGVMGFLQPGNVLSCSW